MVVISSCYSWAGETLNSQGSPGVQPEEENWVPQFKALWTCFSSDQEVKINLSVDLQKKSLFLEVKFDRSKNNNVNSNLKVEITFIHYLTKKDSGRYAEFRGVDADLSYSIDNQLIFLSFHGDQPERWLRTNQVKCEPIEDFLTHVFPQLKISNI